MNSYGVSRLDEEPVRLEWLNRCCGSLADREVMHDLRQTNAYLSGLARNHVLPKYEIMESLNNINMAGSLSVRAGRNQFFIYNVHFVQRPHSTPWTQMARMYWSLCVFKRISSGPLVPPTHRYTEHVYSLFLQSPYVSLQIAYLLLLRTLPHGYSHDH